MACHGEHGATVKHDQKPVRVPWENILGHKQRKPLMFFVRDQGEDGAVVEDEQGKRSYVHGYKSDETLGKALPHDPPPKSFDKLSDAIDHAARAESEGSEATIKPNDHGYDVETVNTKPILLFKAIGGEGKLKNNPRVHLDPSKHRYVLNAPDQPAGDKPKAPQAGDHVHFQAGEFRGKGKVTAVGKDGMHIEDAAGREHRVAHHEVKRHIPGEQKEPKASSPEEIAKTAADPEKFASLPPKAAQPSKDPDELYAKAGEALNQLKEWLNKGKGIASQMGYQTMTKGPDDVTPEEWDKPGGMLFIAGLKKRDGRAAEKVEADYGGDWSQLCDIVRCTLATDNLNGLSDAIKTLEQHGMKVAKQPKNKFLKPTPQGYRDMNFVVRLPNGVLAEVQFNVKDMLKAKNIAHHDYEITRKLDDQNKVNGEQKPFSEWSDEDRKAWDEANQRQIETYNSTWLDHVKKHYGSDEKMVKSMLLIWRISK